MTKVVNIDTRAYALSRACRLQALSAENYVDVEYYTGSAVADIFQSNHRKNSAYARWYLFQCIGDGSTE